MSYVPYVVALTALAASAITFAAEPIPTMPSVPQTPSIPSTPSLPTPITKPAVPATTQPPLDATQTVNCPDMAPMANPAESANATPVGKAPPKLAMASAFGPKPTLKPDTQSAAKVAGAMPATKPYASTINPTAGAADPCAKADPLKGLKPAN